MIEIFLGLITLFLFIIGVLIKVVWDQLQKKISEMIESQAMFIQEVVEIKEDIASLLSWQKSQEKRIDKLEE